MSGNLDDVFTGVGLRRFEKRDDDMIVGTLREGCVSWLERFLASDQIGRDAWCLETAEANHTNATATRRGRNGNNGVRC